MAAVISLKHGHALTLIHAVGTVVDVTAQVSTPIWFASPAWSFSEPGDAVAFPVPSWRCGVAARARLRSHHVG